MVLKKPIECRNERYRYQAGGRYIMAQQDVVQSMVALHEVTQAQVVGHSKKINNFSFQSICWSSNPPEQAKITYPYHKKKKFISSTVTVLNSTI